MTEQAPEMVAESLALHEGRDNDRRDHAADHDEWTFARLDHEA